MPDTTLTPRARSHVLAVLLSALFMSLLAIGIINVALPAIQEGLDASPGQIQWALSGYSLAIGVVLVAAGRAGDVLGRRRLFLAGTILFGVASGAAALAPDAIVLDVARFAMGLGAGLYSPQVVGLIQEHYRGAERARAFGYFGAIVGVAIAIGPTLGGFLLGILPEGVGWRTTLGINVPVAFAVVVLGCAWIPRASAPKAEARRRADTLGLLDPVGAALLGIAVVAIMLPFIMASEKPWVWSFLPGGLALLGLWWAWETSLNRRGYEPMVSPSLLRIPSFTLGTATITVFFAGMTSIWVVLALFVQRGLGQSALVSGLLALPSALAQVVSAPLAGRLVPERGRRVVIWGMWLSVFGLLATLGLVLLLPDGSGPWWFALSALPLGFGVGWVTSPNQALTLRDVPVSVGGTASGIMQTGQRVSTAVGTAAVTGIFFHQLDGGYDRALAASLTVVGLFIAGALAVSYVDLRASGRGERDRIGSPPASTRLGIEPRAKTQAADGKPGPR